MRHFPAFGPLLVASLAGAAEVPDDPRLGGARAEIQAVVDETGRAGLPDQVIADKVREGLAKGVPPARLAAVARMLGSGLVEARAAVEGRLHVPRAQIPPALLRAIVEARMGGASAAEVAQVLDAAAVVTGDPAADARVAARAIEVLSDLLARGFPALASVRAVTTLLRAPGGERGSLERLATEASRLWKQEGGAAESVLEEAAGRAARTPIAGGDATSGQSDRGANREASGKRLGVEKDKNNNGKGKGRN